MSQAAFDTLIAQSLDLGLRYDFWPAVQSDSRKFLIVLHGRGDTAEGFHWLPEALGVDEFNYLFLEAPDIYAMGYSWYAVPPDQGPGVMRSRNKLFALLDTLQEKLQLSSLNFYLLGFSQGCLMSLDVALRYPKNLGGVVGISGYVFFENEYPTSFSKTLMHQHIFVTHGTQDDVLAIERSRQSIERLQKLGAPIDWKEYEKVHTVDDTQEIEDIRNFLRRQLDAS